MADAIIPIVGSLLGVLVGGAIAWAVADRSELRRRMWALEDKRRVLRATNRAEQLDIIQKQLDLMSGLLGEYQQVGSSKIQGAKDADTRMGRAREMSKVAMVGLHKAGTAMSVLGVSEDVQAKFHSWKQAMAKLHDATETLNEGDSIPMAEGVATTQVINEAAIALFRLKNETLDGGAL